MDLNELSPQPNQQPNPTQPTKLSTSKLAMGQHILNVWGIHYVLSNIIGRKTRNPKAICKFLKNQMIKVVLVSNIEILNLLSKTHRSNPKISERGLFFG